MPQKKTVFRVPYLNISDTTVKSSMTGRWHILKYNVRKKDVEKLLWRTDNRYSDASLKNYLNLKVNSQVTSLLIFIETFTSKPLNKKHFRYLHFLYRWFALWWSMLSAAQFFFRRCQRRGRSDKITVLNIYQISSLGPGYLRRILRRGKRKVVERSNK